MIVKPLQTACNRCLVMFQAVCHLADRECEIAIKDMKNEKARFQMVLMWNFCSDFYF